MHDFNVVERLVQVAGTDTIIPKRKVIVREDDGTPLGLVSDKYQVVKHADMVESFEAALAELPSFRNYQVTTSLPFNGAQMYRRYIFDNLVAEPKVGDVIKMAVELQNSYDGRTKGGYLVQGMRLACTNGQMVPGKFVNLLTKHFPTFKLERIVEGLAGALPLFENTIKTWRNWHDVKVNAEALASMLEKTDVPEKTVKKIVEKFATEDQTKYGAFQAVTWVITHETKSRVEANSRVPQIALERAVAPVFYGA